METLGKPRSLDGHNDGAESTLSSPQASILATPPMITSSIINQNTDFFKEGGLPKFQLSLRHEECAELEPNLIMPLRHELFNSNCSISGRTQLQQTQGIQGQLKSFLTPEPSVTFTEGNEAKLLEEIKSLKLELERVKMEQVQKRGTAPSQETWPSDNAWKKHAQEKERLKIMHMQRVEESQRFAKYKKKEEENIRKQEREWRIKTKEVDKVKNELELFRKTLGNQKKAFSEELKKFASEKEAFEEERSQIRAHLESIVNLRGTTVEDQIAAGMAKVALKQFKDVTPKRGKARGFLHDRVGIFQQQQELALEHERLMIQKQELDKQRSDNESFKIRLTLLKNNLEDHAKRMMLEKKQLDEKTISDSRLVLQKSKTLDEDLANFRIEKDKIMAYRESFLKEVNETKAWLEAKREQGLKEQAQWKDKMALEKVNLETDRVRFDRKIEEMQEKLLATQTKASLECEAFKRKKEELDTREQRLQDEERKLETGKKYKSRRVDTMHYKALTIDFYDKNMKRKSSKVHYAKVKKDEIYKVVESRARIKGLGYYLLLRQES